MLTQTADSFCESTQKNAHIFPTQATFSTPFQTSCLRNIYVLGCKSITFGGQKHTFWGAKA